MRILCNILDFFYFLPPFSNFRNIFLTICAVFVTIFANDVSKIGISLQLPLAFITLLIGLLPFLSKWVSQKLGLYIAKHVFKSIKQIRQQWLSFNRRISNENQSFEWLKTQFPLFASRLVTKELINIVKNS